MSIASLAFRCVASLLACLVFATLFPVLRATAMSLAHHAGNAFACAIGDNDSRSRGKSRRRSAGVPGHPPGAWKHASARTSAHRSPRLARVNAAERADAITPGGFQPMSRGPGSGPLASLSPRSTLARGVGDGEKRRGEGIGDASLDGSSGISSSDGTASEDDERVSGTAPAASSGPGPTHLFVLVHGLGGTPEDLCCLEHGILKRAGSSALVLKPGCNLAARSFDGVPNGAQRVAAEIQLVARAYEASLETVSLVGNSLGGLYARHAAAQLYDEKTRTIAGLVPDTYLTTATPHLGVGPFGYLGYFPSQIRALGAFAMGQTTRQLLLLDGDDDVFGSKNADALKTNRPLLLQMADPSSEYVAALGAFKRRCAYANAMNDFLVAYETAALDPDAPETLRRRRAKSRAEGTNANGWGDDRDASPGGWGFPSPSPSPLGGFSGSARIVDERVTRPTTEDAKAGGAFWRARSGSGAATKRKEQRSDLATQRAIAAGLRTMEWFHVDVEFPGVAPLAHNKICALQRDPVMKFLFKEGEWVVEHQAEYLTGRRK